MKRKLLTTIALSTLWLFLTGCGASVRGTVTYFYDSVPPAKGTTVAVITKGDQAKSLEWDVYKTQIETQLEHAGFVITSSGSQPDLVCTALYSMDAAGDTRTRAVPLYGRNGVVLGVRNVTTQVHQRVLILQFFKHKSDAEKGNRPVAEIRVLSEGSSSELASVMPALTKIAFAKWPGKEGKTYDESAPLGN